MKIDCLTRGPCQTKKIGEILAKELKGRKPPESFILGLEGDLGGGKTTFLQGFARGLGVREKITSPTFVIMRKFKIKKPNFKNFYHFDCYRLKSPKEILNLNFKKIISDPKNIVAVEWVGQVKKILPKSSLLIKFEFINKKTRKIVIKLNNGS